MLDYLAWLNAGENREKKKKTAKRAFGREERSENKDGKATQHTASEREWREGHLPRTKG